MYCKMCGKFIGNDTDVCDECKQSSVLLNENTMYNTVNLQESKGEYPQAIIVQDNTPINLGKAIAAMVLAMIGTIFVSYGFLAIFNPIIVAICVAVGLVPTILGLIFGCQSILNFKKTTQIRSGKRIPVLILGIASVVDSGVAIFYSLFCIIIAVMI